MPYEGTVTGLNLPEGLERIETGIVVLWNCDGFEVAGGSWTDWNWHQSATEP